MSATRPDDCACKRDEEDDWGRPCEACAREAHKRLGWLVPGTPAWDAAWAAVAAHPLNAGLPDPFEAWNDEAGEGWQYMGDAHGAHEFRHRAHPRTGRREYLQIPAGAARVAPVSR